ncbi:MAG TPA: carboxypeptidase-like regulatory domain-containing protein [Candidatus Acidoferrum sp.]|nr:carboxypeptidase-like regulatory domain-containing protein [Candidatus Acidoferrum sp.]
MKFHHALRKGVFALGMLALVFTGAKTLEAQTSTATLSGSVTDNAGKAVAGAKVAVENLSTLETTNTKTDSAGHYTVANLAPGDYELSVSAEGFGTTTMKFTITAGESKSVDAKMSSALSLNDLGFSQTQTQSNPQEQARLNRRSHMLQVHQRLGLITTAPLVATVIAGAFAGGHATSSTNRDLHAALGSATAGLYFASAYYAIFAPKIPGTKTEGPIRWHKILAWIHGPGMILTPILGEMAFSQKSKGERIHGIARAHGPVAIVTAGAYGAAILTVSIHSGAVKRSAKHVAAALHLEHSDSDGSSNGDDTDANQ